MKRDRKGKYLPGESPNPAGRPKGIRDRRHALSDALGARSRELLDIAIERALAGDAPILTALLNRVIPAAKPTRTPVTLRVKRGATAGEIAEAVAAAAVGGELPSDQAAEIATVLANIARLHEIDALRDRLAAIEQAMKEGRQ